MNKKLASERQREVFDAFNHFVGALVLDLLSEAQSCRSMIWSMQLGVAVRKEQNLEEQLSVYGEMVQAPANAGTWRDQLGNWKLYAAAVGSSLAMTSAAEADVIYQIGKSGGPVKSFRAATNGAANVTFTVGANNSKFILHGSAFHVSSGTRHGASFYYKSIGRISLKAPIHGQVLTNGAGIPKAFPSGTMPPPTSGPFHAGTSPMYARTFVFKSKNGGATHSSSLKVPPHFPKSQSEYVAVRLTTEGQPLADYWIHLKYTAATPEPSTAALALLGGGATALLAWRKRRKKEQATAETSA